MSDDERRYLIESLQRLEVERADGIITDEEYEALKAQQTVRLADLLRQAEAAPEPRAKRQSKPVERRKWLWIVGAAAFVLLAVGGLLTATGDRLAGETGTGTIAADSNTLLRQARQQTGQGEAAEALRTYDRVLALDPDNVEALAYKGWLIRLAGLPARGEESIDRAIQIDPTYPDARFFKGFILLRDRNQPAAAVPQFEAFLANDPPAELRPLVQQALDDARAQAAAQAR